LIWKRSLAPVLVLLVAGCGGLIKSSKTVEQRNDKIPGSKYKSVAVIAGDETRNTIRLSAQVRETMNNNGITALRRAGRWASQLEAFNDICRTDQETKVDGVLVVTYDRLELHDCDTKGVAYYIVGGSNLGLPQMTDRLLAYLRT
jgi:hypothetical protein